MANVERGQIYFVNLDPIQGHEQGGQRPVLVISTNAINRLPLVVTVIVGTKGENITTDYPVNVRVLPTESGLAGEAVFLCFQMRSLDHNRFPKKPAGQLKTEAMQKIETALRYCLGLS